VDSLANLFKQGDQRENEALVPYQKRTIEDVAGKLNEAIQNHKLHFGKACEEIRGLRSQLGEQEWTNRELRVAIKEKNFQIKKLLQKIEKFEEMLQRKVEKRRVKERQLPRPLTEQE